MGAGISQVNASTDLWASVLGALGGRYTEPVLNMWVRPLRVVTLDGSVMVLAARSSFARDWIAAHPSLPRDIGEVVSRLLGDTVSVRLVVAEDAAESGDGTLSGGSAPAGQARGGGEDLRYGSLNVRYTFEEFVIGNSNRFAHAAAQAVAEAPARSYNPLFLYGGVGLGKTHLMHAIGHRVQLQNPSANVVYVSSEQFTNEFIIAIKNNQTAEFRNKYRHVDVLLIDDIQFLEGKEQTQEEFFHTFNSLHDARKQLVISSDRPPKEIQTLESRLRSRFEWGLLTDVQPPDLETREAILRKKAESENIPVPNEVTSFIAKVIPSNIRELEGALIRVVAFASLTKSAVTTELAGEVLKNSVNALPARRITVAHIKDKVARAHGLTVKEMDHHRRDQRIAAPRHIAMYLACELTGFSLPHIAREFQKKDHTTIMYARDKVKGQMATDEAYRNKVLSLLAVCQND